MTGTPYTHGVWNVTPGREEEFVAAWQEFADWTLSEVPGSKWGKLLRDSSTPSRFVRRHRVINDRIDERGDDSEA